MTDVMAVVLWKASLRMMSKSLRNHAIRHDDFTGFLTTEFERCNFGSIAGVVFSGEVEGENGLTKIRFVTREMDETEVDDADIVIERHEQPPQRRGRKIPRPSNN